MFSQRMKRKGLQFSSLTLTNQPEIYREIDLKRKS